MTFVLMAIIGLAAGVFSAMLGVGGGVIMVPALVFFGKMPMMEATLTSLAVIIPTAIMGVYQRVHTPNSGSIDWPLATAVAVGAMMGAWVGAKLVAHTPDKTLRQLFAFLLIFTAVRLLFATR